MEDSIFGENIMSRLMIPLLSLVNLLNHLQAFFSVQKMVSL